MTATAAVPQPSPPAVQAPAATATPIRREVDHDLGMHHCSPRAEPYMVQVTAVGGERRRSDWRPIQARSIALAGITHAVRTTPRHQLPVWVDIHVMRDHPDNRWENGNPRQVAVLTVQVGA